MRDKYEISDFVKEFMRDLGIDPDTPEFAASHRRAVDELDREARDAATRRDASDLAVMLALAALIILLAFAVL